MPNYDPDTGAWLGTPEPVTIPDGTPEPTPDPTYTTPDPRAAATELFHTLVANGTGGEDAAAEAFSFLAAQAQAGDRRPIVNDKDYRPLQWANDPRRTPAAARGETSETK